MKTVRKILRTMFPKRIRVALYGAVVAADVSLVSTQELPAWTLPVVPILALALLNLREDDVEDGDADPGL